MIDRQWIVDHWTASAAEIHTWDPPADTRVARWCEVTSPALVLGSAQSLATVDLESCAEQGIDVVRRRSGGGAVLTWPSEMIWLDVVVPAGDRVWDDDVGRSMWWLGQIWAESLDVCGVADVEVHRGPLLRSRWSAVVCFEGLGPGEVTVGGRKAVGISQRRTRHWARLQVALHHRWRSDVISSLISGIAPAAAELRAPFCLERDRRGVLQREVERRLAET